MAVTVRLSRKGNRNNPFYRVVAMDNRRATDARYIERLGWYNPNLEGVNCKLDLERIEYWQSNGAKISDTVRSLVKNAKNAPAPVAEETAPAPETPVAAPAAEPAVEAETPAPAEDADPSSADA